MKASVLSYKQRRYKANCFPGSLLEEDAARSCLLCSTVSEGDDCLRGLYKQQISGKGLSVIF